MQFITIVSVAAKLTETIISLAMKLLIAVALLVVGLSPCPGFSQFGEGSGQTTEALTEAPTEAPNDGK